MTFNTTRQVFFIARTSRIKTELYSKQSWNRTDCTFPISALSVRRRTERVFVNYEVQAKAAIRGPCGDSSPTACKRGKGTFELAYQ